MLLIAHRGCHSAAPENSRAAFCAARAAKVDGVEIDVRRSRDGAAVLVHDRLLAGTAVESLDRAQISAVLGHPVAELGETLAEFPEFFWNVEIKTPDALAPTVEALRRYRPRRLLVSSFRHDLAARCAMLADVPGGLLCAHRPLALAGLGRPPGIDSLVWDYDVLDDELVREAAAAGLRNFAYGAVTADEHRRCRELPLAGIITDYPERAGSLSDPPPSER